VTCTAWKYCYDNQMKVDEMGCGMCNAWEINV